LQRQAVPGIHYLRQQSLVFLLAGSIDRTHKNNFNGRAHTQYGTHLNGSG
jgi:hypothetical protein